MIEIVKKTYTFSIILPLVNDSENFIKTIESIIKQSIGFENYIQLILVDNISNKQNIQICNKYIKKYPMNIFYITANNTSSDAELYHLGMKLTQGEYINFSESGCVWEETSFQKLYNIIFDRSNKHKIIVSKTKYLTKISLPFNINKRFSKIENDIRFDCEHIQVELFSTFIHYSLSKIYQFDQTIEYGYKLKYFHQLYLHEETYINCVESIVFSKSLILEIPYSAKELEWEKILVDIFDNILPVLQNISIKKYGMIIPYIQNFSFLYILMLMRMKSVGRIKDETIKIFMQKASIVLQDIPINFILNSKLKIWKEEKVFLLKLKYGKDISSYIKYFNNAFYFFNYKLFDVNTSSICKIFNIEVRNNILYLNGRINIPLNQRIYDVFIRDDDGNIYTLNYYDLDRSASKYIGDYKYHNVYGYRTQIHIKDACKLSFILKFSDLEISMSIGFEIVTRLSNYLKHTYCVLNNYCIQYENKKLVIQPNNFPKHIYREICVLKDLIKKERIRTVCWRIIIQTFMFLKTIFNIKIWLFMDKFSSAGDNAEDMFKFVQRYGLNKAINIFCVSKKSADYKKLKKEGIVIPSDTKIYRLMFAICDVLISSQTFYSTGNTFYGHTEYLKDLFLHKVVYLQHGVIKDNHADTQSKHKKAVDLFVVSGIPEYKSLIRDWYGYTEREVKLTGLARYDKLYQIQKGKSSNIIILAPTWRKLDGQVWNERYQRYNYMEEFKNSKFYKFYNSFLNDTRILSALEFYSYKIELQLHPRLWEQTKDFNENERIIIRQEHDNLESSVSRCKMLITDYSSIAFDYAYVKIPIVYVQFDKDEFYSNHAYTRGYFNFENDGFGPVCYDYEAMVKIVIDTIKNNCVMDEKYKKRVDNFFAYHDNKNCERIYQEILKLDKE